MVRNRLLHAALLATLVSAVVITLRADGQGVLQERAIPALAADPPMLGVHWARGEARGAGPAAGANPNLTWHNGAIMPSTFVQAIYWGPSWLNSGWSYKINGLDIWHQGIGASSFADTSNEYTGSNGSITSVIDFG